MKKILLPLLFCATLSAGARQYWALDPDGNAIEWKVDSSSYGHTDHIEMAGKQIATVLRYGINNDGSFGIDKSLVFPMLRTIPNDTHASFQRRVTHDIVKDLAIGRNPMKEKVKSIRIADGCLEVESHLNGNRMGELQLIRRYFPSTDNRGFIELYTAKNIGNNAVELEIPSIDMRLTTNAAEGIDAPFTVHVTSAGKGGVALAPGESVDFSVINTAHHSGSMPPKNMTSAKILPPDLQGRSSSRLPTTHSTASWISPSYVYAKVSMQQKEVRFKVPEERVIMPRYGLTTRQNMPTRSSRSQAMTMPTNLQKTHSTISPAS